MAFGVTAEGFNPKTLDDCRADLQQDVRAVIGPAANLAPTSRLGQLIDIQAERLAEVWALGAALADSLNPGGATGVLQDHLAALTGVTRRQPSKTIVVLVLWGSATTVPAGSQVGQPGTSAVFSTLSNVNLLAAFAHPGSGATVSAGFICAVGGSLFYATKGGVTGTATPPSGTGTAIADGTVTWRFITASSTTVGVAVGECTLNGSTEAFAGSCTTILTPVAGWAGVTNPFDGQVGYDLETDTALRVRREAELAPAAQTPFDSIRTAVLKVDGVQTCALFENTSDAVVDGMPAHSIEALVEGGIDADIAKALLKSVPGGIETAGSSSATAVDVEGDVHTLKFSRPTPVAVTVVVSLQKDARTFPVDGAALVSAAINDYISNLLPGRDVYASALSPAIFSVTGVLNVVSCTVNGGSSVSISPRQRPTPAGAVTVTATNGVV